MKGQKKHFHRLCTTAYLTLLGVLLFGGNVLAAESLEKDTVFEEDTTLADDTVIAKDVTLTIADGVTLTVPDDITLTIYGCLETKDGAVIKNSGTIKYSKSAEYDESVIEGEGSLIPLSDQTYRSVDVRKVFEDPNKPTELNT